MFGKGKGKGGPYGEGGSDMPEVDDALKVFVGNLSFKLKWQELKDFMKQAGEVQHAKIFTKGGDKGFGKGKWDPWGWSRPLSKGKGVVIFKSPEEAANAIATLNGMELDG